MFTYNNTKNANTGCIFFKLNCRYYFYFFHKKNFNLYPKSKNVEKLFFEFINLMAIYK